MGLISSEWLKLRSIRSTYVILALAASMIVVVSALTIYVVGVWDEASPARRADIGYSPPSIGVSWTAALCLAILGVLAITGEHATGTIRGSVTAVPKRGRLLTAKAAVVGGVGLAFGLVSTMCTFFLNRAIIGDRPIRLNTSPVADEIPLLLSQSLLIAVFALLGLGLGALMRSTAGAIGVVLMLWYVVPILAGHLPAPWDARISSIVPIRLAEQLAGDIGLNGGPELLLSPAGALVTMAAYATIPVSAAVVLIRRRDVR